MRTIFRLLALAGAAAATLAFAGSALAKTPQLLVGGSTATGGSAATVIEIKEEKTDAAPLRISIYMPTGYAANITQAAGTQVGVVHADLQALTISPDAIIPADGTVLAAAPTTSTLQASATQCTGTPTHTAIWLLHITVAGQTLDVPIYLDPTTGTEAAFSSAKLVICLPNPYEQAAPGTRAASGAKIIDAKLTLNAGVVTNPSSAGAYLWRTVITPWTANGATPNAAGTIETQSIVNLPSTLSLTAKLKTIRHKKGGRTTVTNSVLLSGKLLENLQGVAGATVTFYAGSAKNGSAKTSATGSFSRNIGLKKKTTFKVTAVVPTRETACVSALPATSVPGGCVSATIAGYTITSNTVTATPKKK